MVSSSLTRTDLILDNESGSSSIVKFREGILFFFFLRGKDGANTVFEDFYVTESE